MLAAHRAGLKEVILPIKNEADLEDLPEEVLNEIKFHFVDTMDKVLKLALEEPKLKRKTKATAKKTKKRTPNKPNKGKKNV